MKQNSALSIRAFLTAAALIFLLGPPLDSRADQQPEAKAAYVEHMVSILRTQVTALRFLLENEIKYSDNTLRHAVALEQTFGMIGPMEWHAAEAFNLMKDADIEDPLTEEQFADLADRSEESLEDLTRAADSYLRSKNAAVVTQAIRQMMEACSACHSKLPVGSVPKVWKGMKE